MSGTGDQRFKTLIEPHLDALFRAAFRLARNRADAEDLVQETCVRACLRLEEIEPTRPVKAWLLRVLHNLFVDEVRHAHRSPVDARKNGTVLAMACASPDPTPEDSAANDERLAQLERAWLKLDSGHRALLAFRAEGYTLSEISAITEIAMDALTMRLYRARQSLARCLKEERTPQTKSRMEANR
jgi:RNA polymerase sigma-70 factor (ECF subfamily)